MNFAECCWQEECTCPKADELFHWRIAQSLRTSNVEYSIKANYCLTIGG